MTKLNTDGNFRFHPLWAFDTPRVGILAAICIVILSFYYRWWRNHPLYGRNPGAKAYPFVGNMIEFLWTYPKLYDLTERFMRQQQVLTIRYVVPGMATHITADPACVEYILKTNFDNYPKGELFRMLLHDVLGNGILNTDDELWRMQRKIAAFEFSMRSLRNLMFLNVQEEMNARLIPILSHACDHQERTLDLQDILKRFNFDNICRLTCGVDPGCLEPSLPILAFDRAFDEATADVAFRFAIPDFLWKFFRATNIFGERRLKLAMADIRHFIMSVILERRKEMAMSTTNSPPRIDLLSRFMQHRTDASEELSDEFLCDALISFFQAGRDSVAAALTWFFWRLTLNPRVEEAISGELAGITNARNDSPALEKSQGLFFSFEELKEMHYLQAAIFESMRMNAPVPSDLKMAKHDDVWPDGTRIHKGQFVGYHPYAMGRLEALWGPDCGEYKPERWLRDGVFVAENSFKFPVFQAGPRICLGREVAIMQMKLIAAAVLQQFRVSVPEGFEPAYRLSFVLPMAEPGLPVYVHRR